LLIAHLVGCGFPKIHPIIELHFPLAEDGVKLGDHLERLVKEAEARLQEMAAMPVTEVGNEMHSLGGSVGSGSEKQRAMWERRVRSLKKMLLGFEQSRA